MAKAVARFRGRDYVIPRDVQEVFVKIVEHRLLLTASAETNGVTGEEILTEIVGSVAAPRLQ